MSKTKKINKIILDDHGLAVLTNLLTKAGKDYGQTQQLRERIAGILRDYIETEQVDPIYQRTPLNLVQPLPALLKEPYKEPKIHAKVRERELTGEDRARLSAVLERAITARTHRPYHGEQTTLWICFDDHTFHQLPAHISMLSDALQEVEAFISLRKRTYMSLFRRYNGTGMGTTLHLRSEHWDDCSERVKVWLTEQMVSVQQVTAQA